MANQIDAPSKVGAEPNELLVWLKHEDPNLIAEDAFVLPLWFPQQNAWLEQPLNSDNSVYNYPLLLRIRGPLNEIALERSLQEIVQRQETLRSVLRLKNGELVQIVVPPMKVPLRVTDLSGLPETEREARAQRLALQEAHRPFDLTKAPLLRSVLMRVSKDDHILQLTTHHIVHDDWSTTILSRELSELYQAFVTGSRSSLYDLAFQYGDYVRWQGEQLRRKASRFAYWKKQLASPTGFQHLTPDFPQPARCSNRGARDHAALPSDLVDALKTLGRQERVSLFMVLLAGFQCLLQRYSNHDELGIASCAANRPLMEVEGLMGRFANDILLRTSLSGNPTFRELLPRARESCLAAYSDQDLPFGELLKEEVVNGAEPNRALPFQVMFILQNAAKENWQVPELSMSWLPLDTGTAKYDLNVWLKLDSTLEVTLEYRSELFQAATMKQILADYETILRKVVKDAGARVSDLLSSRTAMAATNRADVALPKQMQKTKKPIAPNDDVQSRLVKLWEAAFRIRPIGPDQDFFELGGDSLLAARLFTQIERTFESELPLAALLEAPTIKQLAAIISGGKTCLASSSIVAVQPLGTNPPLFCVHAHRGEIFYCRSLSQCLGVDQPLFGLTPPDTKREPSFYTIEALAVHYLKEIRAVQPRGPYVFAGWCFGGMVAYEMARLLKTQSEEVAQLLMFNAPAPGSLKYWPLRQGYLRKRIAHELSNLRNLGMRERLAVLCRKAVGLARLAFGSFKTALWHALAKSSLGNPDRVRQRFLNLGDLSVSAAKAYSPDAYPGRITLFLTEEARYVYGTDPAEGWAVLAGEGIEVHSVAGDNNSLFRAPFVGALAEKVKSCISKARMDGPEGAKNSNVSSTEFSAGVPSAVPT